jgi:hypothetical protein
MGADRVDDGGETAVCVVDPTGQASRSHGRLQKPVFQGGIGIDLRRGRIGAGSDRERGKDER